MKNSNNSILKIIPYSICVLLVLISCQSRDQELAHISTPSKEGGEPNLHISSDGTPLLSWIEYDEDMVSLVFSRWKDDQWSIPKEIAKGNNWFVNWADFPSLVTYKNNPNHLAAHWLEKSAEGTYDYDVRVSQSKDGGNSWSESFVLHTDGIAAEHGFVSFLPLDEGRTFATWLDGRNTKNDTLVNSNHGHGGSMTLRAAEFDIDGNLYHEDEIDDRVCECCQTSAAMTDRGPIVVYRDRSENEIRDIYVSRREDGKWTTPHAVYHDNWHIQGCPVNGPSIVTNGRMVAVAWFSMAENKPEVKVAFSSDNGNNFDSPFTIDGGDPLGRVDMLYSNNDVVLVSWLEQTEDGAEIVLGKVHMKDGLLEKKTLVSTDNSRQSGFPRMELKGNELFIAWTAADSITAVKTGILKI